MVEHAQSNCQSFVLFWVAFGIIILTFVSNTNSSSVLGRLNITLYIISLSIPPQQELKGQHKSLKLFMLAQYIIVHSLIHILQLRPTKGWSSTTNTSHKPKNPQVVGHNQFFDSNPFLKLYIPS
jgi:hypothetical protein